MSHKARATQTLPLSHFSAHFASTLRNANWDSVDGAVLSVLETHNTYLQTKEATPERTSEEEAEVCLHPFSLAFCVSPTCWEALASIQTEKAFGQFLFLLTINKVQGIPKFRGLVVRTLAFTDEGLG